MPTTAYVEFTGQLVGVGSLLPVSSRDQTQLIKNGSKHPCLLSHLSGLSSLAELKPCPSSVFTARTEILKRKGRLDRRKTCPRSLTGSLKWAGTSLLQQGKGGQIPGDTVADRTQEESAKTSVLAGRGRMGWDEDRNVKSQAQESGKGTNSSPPQPSGLRSEQELANHRDNLKCVETRDDKAQEW